MKFRNYFLTVFISLLFLFLTFCNNKGIEKKEKNINETKVKKSIAGLKIDKSFKLKYSFEELNIGDGYSLNGKIKIKLKLFPDIKKKEEYIEIPADIQMFAELIKTESTDKFTFDFILYKLNIDMPGPGVILDYNSNKMNKFLNPQIEKLNIMVNKNIPIIISDSGNINIDKETFFNRYNELNNNLPDETLNKIKELIGYYFMVYPNEKKKSDEIFKSIRPFDGVYKVDSKKKDDNSILILAEEPIKNQEKDILTSFLKGWILIDSSTGILKESFVKFEEKKYISDKEVKIIIIKQITLELNAEKK